MHLTINGRTVPASAGDTVMTAALRAGIHIPHLCWHEAATHAAGACRLCVVEVEGQAKLQTSCTLSAQDGLVVRTHTPRVLAARRNLVELLVASHPPDCLACTRNGNCELSSLSAELGVRKNQYAVISKGLALDTSSPAIARDPNKCVLCGRCVTMCHEVQGVGAIDLAGRGFRTQVATGVTSGLNVSACVFCGQCVRACPTGALVEQSHVDRVIADLADPNAVVVAQVAPAIPVTLLEEAATRATSPIAVLETLATALRQIGFAAVFDTSFAADLTVMEEAAELVNRVESGGVLPMFTSCSPAWVRYVETRRPELIPHLSTCKSPQQMAGAVIKRLYPKQVDLAGKRLVCVSIMPCTAKKAEAAELGDIDHVLTTRELERLFGRFGMNLAQVSERAPLDEPYAGASGAGRIFAASGGVLEAALRTAHFLLTGEELASGLKLDEVRSQEGLRRLSLEIAGQKLGFTVVSGLGRLGPVLDSLTAAGSGVHFVEVMSCPGGCVAGGGQPYDTDLEAVRQRIQRLHELDRRSELRVAHRNPAVQELYRAHLGAPLGEESHRLLHRRYAAQEVGA